VQSLDLLVKYHRVEEGDKTKVFVSNPLGKTLLTPSSGPLHEATLLAMMEMQTLGRR